MNENAAINLTSDVFYVGSAPGEAGDRPDRNAFVNAFDLAAARDNAIANPPGAAIDNNHDFNRDRYVNASDMMIARDNVTNFVTALQLIALSAPVPAPIEGFALFDPFTDIASELTPVTTVGSRNQEIIDAAILDFVDFPDAAVTNHMVPRALASTYTDVETLDEVVFELRNELNEQL